LLEFATHPDEVLRHSTLLQRVWGPEYQRETQYLHVYVQRLRSKIEDDPADPRYIVTETGVGYRFWPEGSVG
jgi:two-component system KDP operon response regulator KdpE